MFRKCLVLVVACLWLAGCGGFPTSPSTSTLQSAAMSVSFAGKTLTLTSYPNRDFMPSFGSSDTSLRMILTIKTGDGSTVPPGVTVDAVWALNESTSWSSWTLSPQSGFEPDYVVSATKGPMWEVGKSVTAVVRLKDASGKTVLLRAPGKPIASSS